MFITDHLYKHASLSRFSDSVQVIFSANPVSGDTGEDAKVQVSYPKFAGMCEKGDTIFVGRYLVTGSEESSAFLVVRHPVCTGVPS